MFLGFINRIKKSIMQIVFIMAKQDVRTTTGANLRNILCMADYTSIDYLKPDIVTKIKQKEIMEEDSWRVDIIKEIVDMKHARLTIPVGQIRIWKTF